MYVRGAVYADDAGEVYRDVGDVERTGFTESESHDEEQAADWM